MIPYKLETLGKVCDREGGIVQTGPFGSQLHQRDYVAEGIPAIMPKDIVDGRINRQSVARITEQKADELARHKLRIGAVVLPRRGEINKRAFITEQEAGWLCGTGCIKVELEGVELLPQFLYYYLDLPTTVRWLEQHAVGTTMLNLSASIVRSLPVILPPLGIQERIASILSAYDDLIENNRRRIQLLEQAARLIYQEWFVRLRFPGYEHARVVDGVPEGWEFAPLSDALVLQRGFDLPTADRRDGIVPILASTGVVGAHDCAKVRGPGVVTGRSGSLGVVTFEDEDFWPLNTALWVKEFKRVSPYYAYFMLGDMRLEQYNGGASVPTLDRKAVHRVSVLIPPPSLVQRFDEYAQPVFRQKKALDQLSRTARTARDLLLPKLMSGEIEV